MSILARLDHPNVVRSLACAEVDGQLLMALEFLEGTTLRQLLAEQGRIEWPRAVAIALEIASGLGAAHCHDPPIVHRDLKPENVMVLAGGRIKVMDFGIAKMLEALNETSTHSAGTLSYMSPEQIDATGIDARSDLYCLGLLLYEMIAGRPPFQSASARELLTLQCTAPPPPLPEDVRAGLPRGIARLLEELLQKSPDDRPASAQDVIAELVPFAPAESAARAESPATQPSTPEPTASAEAPASQRISSSVAAKRQDTIELVDRITAPREISPWLGGFIIVAFAALSAMVTYKVCGASQAGAPASDLGTFEAPDRTR
jgi:serine/threonine-protein kinase